MKTPTNGIWILMLTAVFFCGAAKVSEPEAEARHDKGSHGYSLNEKVFHKAHFYLTHAEEIGLSDEQAEKIKALKIGAKKEMIRKNSEIELLAVDVHAALYEMPIPVEAVNQLVDQKYELKKSLTKTMVQALADVKGILSVEQHTKVRALWAKST